MFKTDWKGLLAAGERSSAREKKTRRAPGARFRLARVTRQNPLYFCRRHVLLSLPPTSVLLFTHRCAEEKREDGGDFTEQLGAHLLVFMLAVDDLTVHGFSRRSEFVELGKRRREP